MAVNGRLDCFALGDVLQVLSLRRASGIVRISGDCAQGEIHLEAGAPVRAGTEGGQAGEDAFFLLLRNSSGEFTFHSQHDLSTTTEAREEAGTPMPRGTEITRRLDALLLQAAHMQTSAST